MAWFEQVSFTAASCTVHVPVPDPVMHANVVCAPHVCTRTLAPSHLDQIGSSSLVVQADPHLKCGPRLPNCPCCPDPVVVPQPLAHVPCFANVLPSAAMNVSVRPFARLRCGSPPFAAFLWWCRSCIASPRLAACRVSSFLAASAGRCRMCTAWRRSFH